MPSSAPRAVASAPTHYRAWRDLSLLALAAVLGASAGLEASGSTAAGAWGAVGAALLALGVLVRRGAAHVRAGGERRRLAAELDASLQSLAASEGRYRAMIEHAGAPILTFDLAENVSSMNRAAELLFGWDRTALVGGPARRLFAEESMRAVQRWTRASLLQPAEPAEIAVTAVHREGRILHLEAHPAVLRAGGVAVGVQIVCRDATARKELERLRADFLAMMGHDIRNPLGAIFGYTEMMLDTALPLAPEQRELLLRINSNTRTVLTLVGNFLEASRIEAGRLVVERRPVAVNAVVRRTVEQYAAHAQLLGVELAVVPAPDLPEIAADALQVERIVANLVTNAIKFTPRGGRVRVATERLPSSVAVAVADTGVGIPPHEFSRIFQRYARSGDRTCEGTGLGLYIVGTLVEAHGGFVTIDSAPGSGTTFTVYLPIDDWRAERPAVAAGRMAAAMH